VLGPLGERRLGAEPFELRLAGTFDLLVGVPLRGYGTGIDSECDRGEGLEAGGDDGRINPVGGNILADRHAVRLAERVAPVEGPSCVLEPHLRPALAAIEQPLPERRTSAGNATRLVSVGRRIVLWAPGTDLHRGLPGDVGRVRVVDTDLPFCKRALRLRRLAWR
jgi:hypothetical protein